MRVDAFNTPPCHLVLRLGSRSATVFAVADAGYSYTEDHQSSSKSGKSASGEQRKACFKSGLAVLGLPHIISARSGIDHAAVAQLAEHHVANVIVVGSNPISRSLVV